MRVRRGEKKGKEQCRNWMVKAEVLVFVLEVLRQVTQLYFRVSRQRAQVIVNNVSY